MNREQGLRRLMAFLGLGDQTPRPLLLTPREAQVVANALDVAASDHAASSCRFAPGGLDDVLADAEHIADLMMLRERFLELHQEEA